MQIYFFYMKYDYFVQDHLTFLNHVYDVVHVHRAKTFTNFYTFAKKKKTYQRSTKGVKAF